MMSEYEGSSEKKGGRRRRVEAHNKSRRWMEETDGGPGGRRFTWGVSARRSLLSLPFKYEALGETFPLDSVSQQCTPAHVQSSYPDFPSDPLPPLPHAV